MRGYRVQIPAFLDLWMRNVRYGTIIGDRGTTYRIKMDNSNIITRIDKDILENFGQWLD